MKKLSIAEEVEKYFKNTSEEQIVKDFEFLFSLRPENCQGILIDDIIDYINFMDSPTPRWDVKENQFNLVNTSKNQNYSNSYSNHQINADLHIPIYQFLYQAC